MRTSATPIIRYAAGTFTIPGIVLPPIARKIQARYRSSTRRLPELNHRPGYGARYGHRWSMEAVATGCATESGGRSPSAPSSADQVAPPLSFSTNRSLSTSGRRSPPSTIGSSVGATICRYQPSCQHGGHHPSAQPRGSTSRGAAVHAASLHLRRKLNGMKSAPRRGRLRR